MSVRLKELLNFARLNLFRCASLVLITSALSVSSFSSTAKGVRRINFKHGKTHVSIRGHLNSITDEDYFVLRAKKGQHMRVEIIGDGPTRGVLLFPNGEQDGGPGGVVYDDTLPATGDYRIRVTESSMGEAWRGNFILKIEIQ